MSVTINQRAPVCQEFWQPIQHSANTVFSVVLPACLLVVRTSVAACDWSLYEFNLNRLGSWRHRDAYCWTVCWTVQTAVLYIFQCTIKDRPCLYKQMAMNQTNHTDHPCCASHEPVCVVFTWNPSTACGLLEFAEALKLTHSVFILLI